MKSLVLLGSAILLQALPQPAAVRYRATLDNVKYVYGVADPVARLRPGQVLETNTLDAFGNAIQKPGDTLALIKGDNPLTGPFFVEGAEPGDTLAIRILSLEVDGTQGVGVLGPGFGALNQTSYTPMLHQDLPERIWFYDIDAANGVASRDGHRGAVSRAASSGRHQRPRNQVAPFRERHLDHGARGLPTD